MTPQQMLKQSAEALAAVRAENKKLAEEKAAALAELQELRMKDQCLKLALKIAEKDGVTDYKDVLAKAEEIRDCGKSLDVVEAGIDLAGGRDFSLGKVASDHRSTTEGISPEDEFANYLMSEA